MKNIDLGISWDCSLSRLGFCIFIEWQRRRERHNHPLTDCTPWRFVCPSVLPWCCYVDSDPTVIHGPLDHWGGAIHHDAVQPAGNLIDSVQPRLILPGLRTQYCDHIHPVDSWRERQYHLETQLKSLRNLLINVKNPTWSRKSVRASRPAVFLRRPARPNRMLYDPGVISLQNVVAYFINTRVGITMQVTSVTDEKCRLSKARYLFTGGRSP